MWWGDIQVLICYRLTVAIKCNMYAWMSLTSGSDVPVPCWKSRIYIFVRMTLPTMQASLYLYWLSNCSWQHAHTGITPMKIQPWSRKLLFRMDVCMLKAGRGGSHIPPWQILAHEMSKTTSKMDYQIPPVVSLQCSSLNSYHMPAISWLKWKLCTTFAVSFSKLFCNKTRFVSGSQVIWTDKQTTAYHCS